VVWDVERTASKFDAMYYRGLLEKAWEETAFVFHEQELDKGATSQEEIASKLVDHTSRRSLN